MKHLMLSRRIMCGKKRKHVGRIMCGKKRKHNLLVFKNSEVPGYSEVSGSILEPSDMDISTKAAAAIASPSVVSVVTRGVSEALKKDHVDRKEYVWMTLSDVRNSPVRVGGALCIDPSGILITTVIATCHQNKIPTYVHAMKGDRVCRAKVEKIFKDCGVLLYRIVKEDISEQFPCLNLETVGDVRLDKKGRLYGYIHEGGPSLDFSYVCGLNNYGIPPNDESFSSSKTMNSMSIDELQDLSDSMIHESAPYRIIGGVVDQVTDEDDVDEDVRCIHRDTSSMFSKLPLIQVSGLGLETYSGQSGCPVFTCKYDDLLGLILFAKGCYCFILPVNVLRYCVKRGYPKEKEKEAIERVD